VQCRELSRNNGGAPGPLCVRSGLGAPPLFRRDCLARSVAGRLVDSRLPAFGVRCLLPAQMSRGGHGLHRRREGWHRHRGALCLEKFSSPDTIGRRLLIGVLHGSGSGLPPDARDLGRSAPEGSLDRASHRHLARSQPTDERRVDPARSVRIPVQTKSTRVSTPGARNPTASMMKCAHTSGITRPFRRKYQPKMMPMATLPMNGPMPW
jgi:hypothetical protein